jgi:uncharacterized lipoprotein YmbA
MSCERPRVNPSERPHPSRRTALATLLAAGGLAAGCSHSPPVQLYHLRSAAPVPVPTPAPSTAVWQLLLPVRLPDYLDREAILLPQGDTGLLALSGHRWAESLRDAVPRVLRQDLGALLGEGRVWPSPLPSGVTATRQLRVEILGFEAQADRASVRLQARWTLTDPQGRTPPRADGATLRVAAEGGSIDRLVAAHRLALWRLAERIVSAP